MAYTYEGKLTAQQCRDRAPPPKYSSSLRESTQTDVDGVRVGQIWRNTQTGKEFVVRGFLEGLDGVVEKALCQQRPEVRHAWPSKIGMERFGTAYTLIEDA